MTQKMKDKTKERIGMALTGLVVLAVMLVLLDSAKEFSVGLLSILGVL